MKMVQAFRRLATTCFRVVFRMLHTSAIECNPQTWPSKALKIEADVQKDDMPQTFEP